MWKAAGAALAVTVAVVSDLARDFRPLPVYEGMRPADEPICPVVRGRPVTIELTPPRPPIGALVPVVFPAPGRRLQVRIREAGSGRELGSAVLEQPALARVSLASPARGRIRFEFLSEEQDARAAPRLLWAQRPPAYGAKVRVGEADAGARGPLLLLQYPWPSRGMLLLWIALLPLLVYALRDARAFPVFLVALGVCGTVTSALLWQAHYSFQSVHWDADLYGHYAETLARYATRPETRPGARSWMGEYPHAHTPLGPALMALPIAAGIRRDAVYVAFSALCSLASLAVLVRLLRRRFEVPYPVAALVVAFCGCHQLFLRSFARPVTDALGHLLTLLTLDLLVARLERPAGATTTALGVLGLLHSLARPQGLAYAPFTALAAVVGDVWRGRRGWRTTAVTIGQLLVLPLVAFAALGLCFGWAHNLTLLRQKAFLFRYSYTLESFTMSLVGVVQLLPLLWLGVVGRGVDGRLAILLGWAIYYLGTLVAVEAPFWMRHFLPLLPVVMVLTALGLAATRGRVRGAAGGLLFALAAANVAAVIYQVYVGTAVPPSLSPFISSP